MSFDPNFPPHRDDPLPGEVPPVEPPPLGTPLSRPDVTVGTGLPRNIAAALACIFPLVGGVVFYILDRRDAFVRFYSLQSIVLGGVFFVLGIFLQISGHILGFIPLLGRLFAWSLGLFSNVLGIVFLILWVILICQAYRGKLWEMPVLWRAAKRHLPQTLL